MALEKTFVKALGFKKFLSISFGAITGLFLMWSVFNASSFVPAGLEGKWTIVFLSYAVFAIFFLSREDIRSKLGQIPFFKSLLFLIPSAFASFFVISLLLGVRDPFPSLLLNALIGVPLYLQLINAFVFATVETSVFQVYLDEKWGIAFSVFTAGLFHMLVWLGSPLQNFFGASVLFLMFSMVHLYARKRFGLMGIIITIGVHLGYNVAKYGILFA